MTRRQNLNSHVLYNTGIGLRPTEIIRSDQVGDQGMRRTSQSIVNRLETKAPGQEHTDTHIYSPCMICGCAGFANELWTASPCPGKASRHGTGYLGEWQCYAAPESALQSSSNLHSFCSFIQYYATEAALLPVSSCVLPCR